MNKQGLRNHCSKGEKLREVRVLYRPPYRSKDKTPKGEGHEKISLRKMVMARQPVFAL